jgi:hypothetical protein
MDLSDSLRSTLEKTRNLAEALEFVGYTIRPRRMSQQGGRRLLNINREIKNFSNSDKTSLKPTSQKSKEKTTGKGSLPTLQVKQESLNEIVNDSPGYLIKKKLTTSIKEINERVKLSRAGKRTIGSFMGQDAGSPSIVTNLKNLSSSWQGNPRHCRYFHVNFDQIDEKPQPYVPLNTGKIEDPLKLPTFNEFLKAKGAEYVVRKGNDELLFRIQKATEKISKLKETLELRFLTFTGMDEKKKRIKPRIGSIGQKVENVEVNLKKTHDLKKELNQYFEIPSVYTSKKIKPLINTPHSNSTSLSIEAEEGLEESLRDFYRIKALENKKLSDILEKLSKDRPNSIREKVSLIQEDKERYKNKNHSIEKFNEFREKVEEKKRSRQHLNLTQALAYLEVLESFKKQKHEPSEAELLILELWRRIMESGWVISSKEAGLITNVLTEDEASQKAVKDLISRLFLACIEVN